MSELIATFTDSTNFSAQFTDKDSFSAETGDLIFGVSATIEVGTVTQGVTAEITNSGTERNAVFNFVLPKGDQGEKGDKPEKGVDYWTDTDKAELVEDVIENLPEISPYNIGSGLLLDEETNTLSVDTATTVEEDNTRPITSAAVYTTVGNIEILLETI